jgi:hypothetical protein
MGLYAKMVDKSAKEWPDIMTLGERGCIEWPPI